MKLLYYLAYGLWYLASLLPLRVLYVLSDCFYLLLCHVVRYRHSVIWRNISTSFPEKSPREWRRIEKDFYHWLCDYFVETIKLMTMSRKQLMRRMRFTGTEEVNRLVEKGQSVAIYLGHYGQWEWITSLPFWVSEKCQCCEIYHPLENPEFDRLFRTVREKRNALCIPMAETLRRVVEYRSKHTPIILGYIADQVPFWNNIHHWLTFLNHDTAVLTGSERIARKMNQAVVYGDVRRVCRGYYECDLQIITDAPASYPEFRLTDIYFQRLEASIRRDPSLYLWSHNRWKRTHEEFNIRFDPSTGRVDLRPLEVIKREKGLAEQPAPAPDKSDAAIGEASGAKASSADVQP